MQKLIIDTLGKLIFEQTYAVTSNRDGRPLTHLNEERKVSIKFRPARKEDVKTLEKLFEEFSDWQLQRTDAIHAAIEDPNGELVVAEVDDQVVAFIHQVFFNDPLHGGLNSDITNLFVKEGHRKKGIASQLLSKALESAKRRNAKEVHITTRENNTRAIRLYEKHGFNKVGILLENNL